MVIGMMLIMAILDMFGVASIMPLMAILLDSNLIENNIILNYLYDKLNFTTPKQFQIFAGFFVFVLLVFSMAFKALTTYLQLQFTLSREYSIGRRLIAGYLSQPYSWFLNRNSSDLGKAVLSEVKEVIDTAMNPIMTLISQGIVTTALICLLILIDPFIAVITGITLTGAYLIIFRLSKGYLKRIGQERFQANRSRFSAVNEAFGAFKEIKIGQHEETYLNRFSQPAEIYAKHQATSQVVSQLPRYALEGIAFGGLIILLVYQMAIDGNLKSSLPVISLYAFAGYRLMPALQQIYSAATQLRFAKPALDAIYDDLIKLQMPIKNHCDGTITLKDKIEIIGISYRFPKTDKLIIKNLSLTICANQTVGLVGATGSGKTTTVDLLLGLLTPTDGILSVDGQRLTTANYRAWQRSISYVTQNIYLSDDTIAANIAFGVSPEDIDMSAIKHAAKLARLDVFIENELSDAYQTKVGERGVRLSGGQRQRIGIARALYTKPSVLILDEATSALDNLTERQIMDAVHEMSKELTIIIIAHRLNTIENCDQIFMLDRGELKAAGTFTQLIETDHQFRAMATRDTVK